MSRCRIGRRENVTAGTPSEIVEVQGALGPKFEGLGPSNFGSCFSRLSRPDLLSAASVGEEDVSAIHDVRLLLHNHTARDAGPAWRILCHRVRKILIVELMDDERAPV